MLSLLLLASFPSPAGTQFDQPVEITRRFERPSALRFGDFDGDGLSDLIGSSGTTGELRLWRGDGAGAFDVGKALPVALSAVTGMSVDDLDGDGDLDLALATPGPSVVWVENLGGGEFAGEIPLAGFGAVQPGSIVRQRILDFDGNGTNDVLMTFDRSSSGQESLVLLASSLGAGAFSVQTLIASPTALYDADAADVDGDGDRDIVVGGSDVGAWYRNEGAGVMSGPITLPLFSGATDEQVAAADVDGDGNLDLVSLQCFSPLLGTVVYVSAGDGAGGFTQQVPIALASCSGSFLLQDVNGDGRMDFLAVEGEAFAGRVQLALGLSSGPFAPPSALLVGDRPFTAVGIGDVDGDGALDLVAGTDGDQVLVYEFMPSAVPPALDAAIGELTETVAFAFRDRLVDTADFNGDGRTDVCVLGSVEEKIAWWPADGSGGFGPLQTIERFPSAPRNAYVADVDGDGLQDVVYIIFETVEYRWQRGDGGGGFGPPLVMTVPFSTQSPTELFDVNGDGRADLVFANGGAFSRLAWAENVGGGSFGPRTTIVQLAETIRAPRFREVNGDGFIDVAFLLPAPGGATTQLVYYAGTGPGTFAAAPTELDLFTPFAFSATSTWDVADMDADGQLDLVVSANAATPPARNRLMLYRGLGGDQFSSVSVFAGSPQAATDLEIADLDGDGLLDILIYVPLITGQADGLVWYRNRNGTQFAPRESLVSSASPFAEFLVGDFDGDGDRDAVFAEGENDAVVRIETLFLGEVGLPYCSLAVPNSTGEVGEMSAFGSALPGAADLTLTATGLPLQTFGLFLDSQTADAVFAMNSVGVLCLGGAIGRFTGPGQVASSGATGSITIDAMPAALPTPQGPTAALAGETWHFQAWHRDIVSGQATSNFTQAVSVQFL